MKSRLKLRTYEAALIAAGGLACVYSLLRIHISAIDVRFLFLSVAMMGLSSRISIKIPKQKGQISVSDTFVFLAFILFGKEAAVLLAAADALCSSIRFSRKVMTIVFNSAVMAFSVFVATSAVEFAIGAQAWQKVSPTNFFAALSLLASVQFICNSSTVAIGAGLKAGRPLWQSWKEGFLWASLTYFGGAFAAGLISKLIWSIGFIGLLAVAPIIVIIFTTYRTYLKNIEVSAQQAEQAERFVAAIKESEERFRGAFDHHAAGMALATFNGKWLRVNRSLCEMLRYSESELLATRLDAIAHPESVGWMKEQITNLLHGSISSIQLEQRCLRQDGESIWASLSLIKVNKDQGATPNLMLQLEDITDRKRAQEQLVHDAFHDGLTGLPNRALFMDHIAQSIERSKRRKDGTFAVVFLDLDSFKSMNDTLGHLQADRLLIEVGRRLKSSVRPSDTVSRLGGDEFTILLEDLSGPDEAIVTVKRLMRNLAEPVWISDNACTISASVGIAFGCAEYEQPEQILRDADAAMYRAKNQGKACYEVFDRNVGEQLESQIEMENELRQAVERSELLLEYQPIVVLDTGKIAGFEALLRWQHPTRGYIGPPDFISVAEDTGAIVPIGQWVLENGCRQIRDWQKICPQEPPLFISINLSVKQLAEPSLIQQVMVALDNAHLDPGTVKLEVTESMIMDDEPSIRVLAHLHALGVEISLDDFGTGYSSLSYLHRLPITTLKVDRSFVSSMTQNKESLEIVRTIIKLAQSLNLKVVAEGIETEDQLEILRELKCDYGQGHFFAKALRVDWAASLLFANATFAAPREVPIAAVSYDSSLVS